MEIVVNEWLLDYLLPNSEKVEKDLVFKFINIWVEKCDKVVIRRPSPFTKKFYKYWKLLENDQNSKKKFKKLNELLLRNPDKTRIMDDMDVKPLLSINSPRCSFIS